MKESRFEGSISLEKEAQKAQKEIKMKAVIVDFVGRMDQQMGLLAAANNRVLEEVDQSFNSLIASMNYLIGETRSISSSLSAMLHTEAPPVPTCPLTQSNEQNLLNQLYGSHASFTHQLVSNNILDQPLYRERNFK